MEKFIIKGGRPLKGEIKVGGAKNMALKIFAAALLSKEDVIIENVPQIEDIGKLVQIMKDLGVKVEKTGKHEYTVNAKNISKTRLSPELTPKLRASVMLLAPLLARKGRATMPHPGGCAIGRRPIDRFLEGFESMGVETSEDQNKNCYKLKVAKLKGSRFVFRRVAVTATESIVIAAVLAKGTTTLINAACEPEIIALAEFLNSCGAKISGAGTPNVTIEGVEKISGGKFKVIPDRIEAGSFIILAAAARSDLVISGCNPSHLEVPLYVLEKKMGLNLKRGNDYVRVLPRKKTLAGTEIQAHEYPGFPTDLQPPMAVLLTQASGMSMIFETIYENRLVYTDMLNRMGANIIMCDPHRVIINGPSCLRGKKVESPDLRAGIAMVIAGLVAEGTTEISNIYQIDRGYENLEKRLRKLGADIRRINR